MDSSSMEPAEVRGRPMPLHEDNDEIKSPRGRTERSHSPSALDWPLSREEKKTRVLQLYDRDTRAADQLLRTGEDALEALRFELRRIREVFPTRRDIVARHIDDETELNEARSGASSPERTVPRPLDEANAALFRVVSDATSVLAACLANQESPDPDEIPKPRAKSEGQRVIHPPKCPKKRHSRGDSTPKRVSFGDEDFIPVSDGEEDMPKREADVLKGEAGIPRRSPYSRLPPPPSVPPPPPPQSHPSGRLPPRPQQSIPGGFQPNDCMALSAFISGPVPQFFVQRDHQP